MHDSTVDRTTNGSGNVEDMFYEQLCEYYVDDKPDDPNHLDGRITEAQGIPTLEKYLMYFKDTYTFIFIEIKSSKADRLVPALKKLLDKYDFYDQCAVICFSTDMIKAVKREIPELSAGWLSSTANFNTILDTSSSCESSYNPSHNCISHSLVKKLSDRGILSWPWTVNDINTFDSLYLCGVAGITTNYANYAKNYFRHIYADKSEYKLSVGQSVTVNISAELYGANDPSDYTFENKLVGVDNAEMIIISSNTDVHFDGSKITASKAGNANVIFRAPFKLNNGSTAYVYTQPITVTVG
jgi:glycerophosphoryl diester phosphodiesterase